MLILIGTLFTTGLLLAGAEGPYFPWLNLFGVAMFGASIMLANKLREP